MDQVDSFTAPIFQTTFRKTADIPGISQFPVGTSSKSPSITLKWAAEETVLPSQMLLLMITGSHSSCMAGLLLLQCTLRGIQLK